MHFLSHNFLGWPWGIVGGLLLTRCVYVALEVSYKKKYICIKNLLCHFHVLHVRLLNIFAGDASEIVTCIFLQLLKAYRLRDALPV